MNAGGFKSNDNYGRLCSDDYSKRSLDLCSL